MYVMLCLMIGLMYIGLGDEYNYSAINSRTSMLFYIAAFLVRVIGLGLGLGFG